MKLFEEEKNEFANSSESIEDFKKYFRRRGIEYSEPSLIEVIKSSRLKNELFYSILALRDIGTDRSVPVLKEACFYSNQDAQSNAMLSINQISKKVETAFYGDCLSSKGYRQKGYALWALLANSNDQAVNQVIDFLEKQLKRSEDNMGYISMSVCYLNRHQNDNPFIQKAFDKVCKKAPKLDPNTQIYLKAVNVCNT